MEDNLWTPSFLTIQLAPRFGVELPGTVGECGCSTAIDLKEPLCFCPGTGIARMIGRRYFLALLGTIGNAGRIRFGELKEKLRISPSTLAVRLEELEAAMLVRREVYAEVPPRVEYSLTKAGVELRERMKTLLAGGHRQAFRGRAVPRWSRSPG